MDKAKAAVSDFMAKAGHHDTTVHEKVAPAVTHETVNPHRHENITTAVDKEIHQDHYHTSVQPVLDREVLPETHKHNLVAVEHRQYEHGKAEDVKLRLEQEAAQFMDKREVTATRETRSTAPVVGGEHIHHHVHETIQPIVQKEVIQPEVVHTTVPIHEVHHNAAQHHTTSALPAVSLADFKKQGGVLTGREERYDGFEGEPRSVGGALSGHHHIPGDKGNGHHGHHGLGAAAGAGAIGAGAAGTHGLKTRNRSGSSSSSSISSSDGEGGRIRRKRGTRTHGATGTTHGAKPSMMEKLNPRVDADGDGKAGFMK
ncbi:uncharacterized protein K452DRAFT_264912 [Aplosporella prunicola CBS 121167]|uniref:Allergen n=1 Tax=Aplosporella prunicola CBS 121167 TaxID=1176127 RepID=A0A6A6BPN0_9PEZI|nr:uncharacterized protein K452DRAFT_264912 [Aplosporella prunicola CBS 121167]KAF2145678.1 hypothetical protein K452DRAFT_264912 [Aplosporella prunicola CBS 121167]